jgi:hypothetical protein
MAEPAPATTCDRVTRVMRIILSVVCLLAAALPASAQVTLTQTPQQIAIAIDGQPFSVLYIAGEQLNRPYLHPLRSASGLIVTRSVPAGQQPGETTDHPHHAGLFYGHGNVSGVNFWAIQNGPASPAKIDPPPGRIVLDRVVSVKSGRESGSLDVVFNWLAPDGRRLLVETRTMTFHAHPSLRIVDVDLDLAAAEAIVFRDTKEGTFALRMATPLEEPRTGNAKEAGAIVRTGTLRNAQGGVREANVWGKRSEWVDYSGELDGQKVGIVLMDHRSNPRHPTYWHSRGYGLHSINPFGVSDFLNDKTKDGSLTIAAGEHVRFRYRIVVHQGASPAQIAELYTAYSRANVGSARK